MNWKQPIPTNLESIFGDDHISRLIYIECLLKATNETRVVNRNGKITKLNRGQCYFTITELAKRLGCNRKTIKKYLEICKNVHNVMDNDIDSFGAVISIKNYDSVTKMDNDADNDDSTTTQRRLTNKNDKNVKNDKNIYAKTFFVSLSDDETNKISTDLNVALLDVKKYCDKAFEWSNGKGKKMNNWYLTIRGWMRKDLERGKLKNKPIDVSNMTKAEEIKMWQILTDASRLEAAKR